MLTLGIEALAKTNFSRLEGKRIGLFTNPSAVNHQLISTYQLLVDADNVHLVALFGAEHGAFGRVQDGDHIDNMTDALTGIPIRSLYGSQFRPSAEMLADIDLMVCDIQDIGVRYYTFQWTMTHIIEACGEHGVPVLVLDRPNPLGGTVAGCGLDSDFMSLVGRFNVPIQHGLTIGEMMRLCKAESNTTPADLTIIPCENYNRSMAWEQAGLSFVQPSPNMPTITTVRQYPGACLIEGTTLSEGRGTTIPFEIVGAPYIDGRALADELNALNLADVRFRPHFFTPAVRKYADEACEGVQVHIMGANFESISTWLHVIHTIMVMYPDDFSWLPPYTDGAVMHFDRLIGNDRPRQLLDSGAGVDEIIRTWDNDVVAFRELVQPYLLYE